MALIDNNRQAVYVYDQRIEEFGSKGSIAADNEYPNKTVLLNADGVYREKPLWFFLSGICRPLFMKKPASLTPAWMISQP